MKLEMMVMVGALAAAGSCWAMDTEGAVEVSVGRAEISGFADEFASRRSFFAAGAVRLGGQSPVALRVGLSFSRKGAEIPADPEVITIDYLGVPVLAELRVVDRGSVRPLLVAGLTPALRVRVHSSQFPDSNSGSYLEKFDCALVGGVGVEVGRHLGLEVTYQLGLRPVYKIVPETRNRVWQAGLRWRL
jgi:hypothetical protein